MSHNSWDLEYAGAGTCGGDFLSADYEYRAGKGWSITYTHGDGTALATSSAPRHPSLRGLAPTAEGEKRVIEIAHAVVDQIEDAVYQAAKRCTRRRVANGAAVAR